MRGRPTYILAAALLAVAALLTIAGVGDASGFPDWQAFVLGVVQGATELLPVSSSGHLVLVPWLGDWTYLEDHPDFNKTFDVALHLGTLFAVVGYFFHELVAMVRAFFRTLRTRRLETPDERLAWIVVVATIPAAVVGLAFEDPITEHLGEPWQIAILLAVFAGVLWLVDRRPAVRQAHELSLREGLVVGVAQALALAPGVSRSGITITAGRMFRLDRDAAARLSFLLVVPTVLGAVVHQPLAGPEALTNPVLLLHPVGWQEHRACPAEHFLCRESKHALRGWVPTLNPPFQVGRQNRIVRGIRRWPRGEAASSAAVRSRMSVSRARSLVPVRRSPLPGSAPTARAR